MVEVKIENLINDKINEYRAKNGATKTWIAEKIGIPKQSLYILCTTQNPTIESLIKVAYVLGCEVSDLYRYEII